MIVTTVAPLSKDMIITSNVSLMENLPTKVLKIRIIIREREKIIIIIIIIIIIMLA